MARFLAIDWDQNQLHVVAGSAGGGRVKFERALVWPEEKSPNPAEAEELGRVLRDRLKSAGVAPAPVLACLGRDRVILKDLRFPAVAVAEEAAVVRFQAVKELNDNPDEVVIDYVAAPAPAGASEKQVLALIARREIIGAYQKLCTAAGLKLAGLTPRAFGFAAGVQKIAETTGSAEPDGAVAVVVVGERWAEFCVLRGSVPLLARSLNVGPGLAAEVRRNLTVYAGQAGRSPVRTLYLAGGGPALREQIGERIDIPMQEFDAFAGAVGLDAPPGSRGAFAGAAGLLFARAKSAELPINFIQPRQPKPPSDPKNRRLVLVAGAVAVAAAVVIVCCTVVMGAAQRQLDGLRRQSQELDAPLAMDREETKRMDALASWDSIVWLDELYDLTTRITDVNALRLTGISVKTVKRTAKDKYSAEIELTATVAGDQGRKTLDDLNDSLRKAGYYSPGAPKFDGNKVTEMIRVERRPPTEYKLTLPPPADKGPAPGFNPAAMFLGQGQ
ncbi:MAG TPA: pilus assembly protein PilM [Gemmataceae bacterium]|nr:pilus assembly protein PilM [Gemmataceae bacterium]